MVGADEIVEGGLYADRDHAGLYRITKLLKLEDTTVHLRAYANRFKELPSRVSSSELSLGRFGGSGGFGIGHYPVAREGFDWTTRTLVGRESVADDELDGYRIWAGIDPL